MRAASKTAPFIPSPHNPLCVVGVGVTSAVGLGMASTAAAVRAGISGFAEHAFMVDQTGQPYVLAAVPTVAASVQGVARYAQISEPALEEALLPLIKSKQRDAKVAALTALPEQRPGLPENLEFVIESLILERQTEAFEIRGVQSVLGGHAFGLLALKLAGQVLAGEEYEFCLVGGVESYLDSDSLDWIEENDQLHSPRNAWGFTPGEAAAFCLVCSLDTARRRKLPVRAQIVSVSSEQETNPIKTESVCLGEGLTKAVSSAISVLSDDQKIHNVICDQNGESYRADEHGFMLCRLGAKFDAPNDFIAPANCWGDVGAASGILFLGLLIAAAENRYDRGPNSLIWVGSEKGQRSAALVRTATQTEDIRQWV